MIRRLLCKTRHAWAGLVAGPVAWALAQQLNYWLIGPYCRSGIQLTVVLNLVFASLALRAGVLSWRVWQRSSPGSLDGNAVVRERAHFIAGVSWVTAGLFSVAIVAQGIAGTIFTGCET